MKQVVSFLLCFIGFACAGQMSPDTIHLFYGINKTVPEGGLEKLDFIKDKKDLSEIRIHGYADYLSGNNYNTSLSQKRAELVRAHIKNKLPAIGNLVSECRGYGEDFSKQQKGYHGEQQWRRVDVILLSGNNKIAPVVKQPVKKADSLPKPAEKKLEELSEGETVALEGLSFVPGRHQVLARSVPVLKKLLETLREHDELKVEIQGHVCCTEAGKDGFDHDTKDNHLSVNRAKAVYQYLIKNGIEKSRLSYRGFGGSRPKVQEDSPENEQVNRRVEILIVENDNAGK
jgi:outer membrane protein OmpA-like peptidoglycan-associated protein